MLRTAHGLRFRFYYMVAFTVKHPPAQATENFPSCFSTIRRADIGGYVDPLRLGVVEIAPRDGVDHQIAAVGVRRQRGNLFQQRADIFLRAFILSIGEHFVEQRGVMAHFVALAARAFLRFEHERHVFARVFLIRAEDITEVFSRLGKKREARHTLTLRIERSVNVLYQDEIIRVEGQAHRTIITCPNTAFSIWKPYGEISAMLDDSFLHIKKGVSVNMRFVDKMTAQKCVMKDGSTFLLRRDTAKENRERYYAFLEKELKSS